MYSIKENIVIETLQIKTTNIIKNISINPCPLVIGKNNEFKEINRVYIRCDIEQIKQEYILKSAVLRLPIICSIPEGNKLNIFLVSTNKKKLIDIACNGINNMKIIQKIDTRSLYSNNYININLEKYIEILRSKNIKYVELLLTSNEMISNNATIKNNMLNNQGIDMEISYKTKSKDEKCKNYIEKSFTLQGKSEILYTPIIEVNMANKLSIFLNNLGDDPVKFIIEDSFDKVQFIDDSEAINVLGKESIITTPYHYCKYMRLKVISKSNNINTIINILGN